MRVFDPHGYHRLGITLITTVCITILAACLNLLGFIVGRVTS
jgi:hypothetical protein